MSRRAFLALGGGATTAALAGCVPWGGSRVVTIGCGERGGSYLQFGELLRDAARGTSLDIEPLVTEGSVDNVRLLADGDVDLALALADTAAAADTDGRFVAIGRVYQNYLQCVARAESGFTGLSDLAGRLVSLGAPGSGAAATAARVLDAAGMGSGAAAPITVEQPFRDAVVELEAGRLDALFWSGGIPTPLIADLASRVPITLVDTTPTLAALRTQFDVYAATTIPAGVYGIPQAVPTIGIPNLLLTRPSFDATAAGQLVDTLIDRATTLAPVDALSIQYLTPSSLIDTSPVPLHPAAAQRYRHRYG